jgi:arabinofuranosyltransferase
MPLVLSVAGHKFGIGQTTAQYIIIIRVLRRRSDHRKNCQPMRARLLQFAVYVGAAIFAVVTSMGFAAFTADDAYIVARYAVNARDAGAWVFNPGEYISAMTSPLHGLMLVALSLVTSDPLPLYKAIAAISVALSFVLLLVTYGIERREAMPLAAVLVSPSLILWTIGGLETPLLAAIITAMAVLYSRRRPGEDRSLFAIAAMAGVAVLTRYDAVLFAGPVFAAALVETGWSRRQKFIAALIAGMLPALWFAYSWLQFGAVLPTSFYIKTPTANLDIVAVNIRYMTEHMVIAGIGVMAVYAVVSVVAGRRPLQTIVDEFRARWGLHTGLLVVLIYGASMATVHMMFAFRHFTPYLAATALALAHLVRRADKDQSSRVPSRATYAAGMAAFLILAGHVAQADALYRRSLEGLGTFGEYSRQGVAGYALYYIPAMKKNAADIENHWDRLGRARPPRIWTFAAGALPYAYREAYIMEQLVSYRHRCPPAEEGEPPDARVWRAHADYIHAFTRHASLVRLLAPVRTGQVTLISQQLIHFNGRVEKLLVFYNPAPLPNALPPGIGDSCTGVVEEGG